MSAIGTTRTFRDARAMSAIEGNADIGRLTANGRSWPIADVVTSRNGLPPAFTPGSG